MSYFAVMCKPGQENTFESLFQMASSHVKKLIDRIISPAIVETKITETSARKRYIKTAMGYIFIKVKDNNGSINIPNELYHFLKNIPVVSKVLPHEIPVEEVKYFCEKTGYNFDAQQEETEVVIEIEKEHEQDDQKLKETNNESSLSIQQQAEEKEPNCIGERMLRLVRKAKANGVDLLKKVIVGEKNYKNQKKVFLRTNHELFVTFIEQSPTPLSHFHVRQPKKMMELIYDYFKNLL